MSETELVENNAADDDGGGEEPTMEEILSSIRRIISDDDDDELDLSELESVEDDDADDDEEEILELTEILAEEEPADMEALLEGVEESDGLLSPDDIDDLEFSQPELDDAEAPSMEDLPDLSSAENLISDQVSADVNQNFNLLANTMLAQNGAGQTVESMVMTLMRPMLKGWLDENLPAMVEKIVREEIERVARGGKM